MLIDQLIEEAKTTKRLHPIAPIARWARTPRAFLMCVPLWEDLQKGKSDEDEVVRQRWAKLEAAMQFFVEEGYMTEQLLKQLAPYKFEHWEMINKKPRPSLRVFGRFAKPDVFVGTHVRKRSDLKGKWSIEFELEKLVCEQHWEAVGLPKCPFPGAFTDAPQFRYEAYITEKATRRLRV
jgi:hypothetical protein